MPYNHHPVRDEVKLTELKKTICSGSVLRLLFLAEKEVRRFSLPRATGRTCKLELLSERLDVPDLRACSTLCSPTLLLIVSWLPGNKIELHP